jgi:hypothetical protein
MAWTPDPELKRLVATTIAQRRDALSQRMNVERGALNAKLAAQNVDGSPRYAGEETIYSHAFEEFANGIIDDVLTLLRSLYGGAIPAPIAPWVRATLSEWLDSQGSRIAEQLADTSRRQNLGIAPSGPAGGSKARRRLDLELGKLEFKARDPYRASASHVFLSHAAVDAPLAAALASEIQCHLPTLSVFVASQPGHIRTGEKWLAVIEDKLASGDTYVFLLTPASVERGWIWFEAGSVWFAKKRLLPVVAKGLTAADVPYPLSARQIQNLENVGQLQEFFRELGVILNEGEAGEVARRLLARS